MLPEAIAACYVRYKAYESAVLGWVVSVSNACGYINVSKSGKGRSTTFGATKSSSTPNASKYIIPRDEILPRVQHIIQYPKPPVQVPNYVIKYLRRVIADREKCNAWFQEYYADDPSISDTTDTHIHYTEMLQIMLSLLSTVAPEPSNPSQSRSLSKSTSLLDLKKGRDDNSCYEQLRISGHVEDLETTEDESPDTSEGSTTAVSENEQECQAERERIYETESTDNKDRLLAINHLLQKLRLFRDYVEDIWSSYRDRHISLIHATVVTNAAIDCARELEHTFATTFPTAPVWGDLIDLLFPEVTAHWLKNPSMLASENINEMDMIFLAPTSLLKAFLDVFWEKDEDWEKSWQQNWLQTWLPDVNKVYDPRDAFSELSPHERLHRNIIFLESLIPELALHAEVGEISTPDRVMAGFKDIVNEKRVCLWVVFSFAILGDIHLILGGHVFRPFKEMRQQLERARKENHDYVENTENSLVNANVIRLGDTVLMEDIMLKIRSQVFVPVEYLSHAQKPFFLFSHHPLLCGSEATGIRLRWQCSAIQVVDVWQHISAVLHLHSALKNEKCLSMPLPFLDGLQELYGTENIFFGNPPTSPQSYNNHYLLLLGFSVKWFAANKRKGIPAQSEKSKGERIRDLTKKPPFFELFENEYSWHKQPGLPQLTEMMHVVQQHLLSRQEGNPHRKSQVRRGDIFFDPLMFVSALSDWLREEQPRLDFDYYRAHNICWRLLRRVETSPKIQKKFREAYHVDDSNVDRGLRDIPSFIFRRHLDDPEGKWMQSVGETVVKFFREEPAETLLPIPPAENLDDPMDVRYAKGYRMSEHIYHPEKNGKCCHIGVCKLQDVHWRLQAGLDPWDLDDVDGTWWQGLRADMSEEDEAETLGSHSKTSAAAAAHTITAEEILALIPPKGISILKVVNHFKGRLHKAQLQEFSTMLKSVSRYHHDNKGWLTPLVMEKKKIDSVASHGETLEAAAASLSQFTITAEEILAIIPPEEGLGIKEVISHFKDRLHKDQMKDFSTLIRSITTYDRDTKRLTPLK